MFFLPIQRLPDGILELAVFRDESQFGRSDIICAEVETSCRVIAKHRHFMDRGEACLVEFLPSATIPQETGAASTDGINSGVPTITIRQRGRQARFHQCNLEV